MSLTWYKRTLSEYFDQCVSLLNNWIGYEWGRVGVGV